MASKAPDPLGARALVSSASWMTGANILAQGFAYASLLVLARILPPESFGTVATGTALVWIAAVLMGSGTQGGLVVARHLTRESLRRTFWICLLVAFGLAAAMAAAAEWLVGAVANGGDSAALAALALALPLYAVALIPTALLQREMEFGKLARVTAGSNIGSAAVALIAGLLGAGVWALVTRQLLWFGLLAALAAWVARPYVRRATQAAEHADAVQPEAVGNRWFLLFGATLLIGLNLDYLVIGAVSDVDAVGLYALAFLVAFAPLQQISSEVGKVLFAAAAASDVSSSGVRTVHAVRIMSMLLLPVIPFAIVLAPTIVPAVLGDKWTDMVAPLQILLVVGIGMAIVNCLGEALSGVGEIAFRAKVNVGWCVATLAALLVLVPLDGIRGAAIAHVVSFVPYAAIYLTVGARRAGTSTRELWEAVRPVAVAVSWQGAATAAVTLGVSAAGAADAVAACAGAAAGVAVLAALIARGRGPAHEALALVRGTLGGEA